MKKEVVIDNSRTLVMVNGKVIPRLLVRMIRGAIGKSFVVKHYKGRKLVVTRFPDMSGIVATEKQRVRRDLFRESVVFAKWIIADEGRKLAFKDTLPRKKRRNVYQAALQLYIREKGNKQWLSKQLAVMAMMESDNRQLVISNGQFLTGGDVFGQKGQWRVLWQKKHVGMADMVKQEVDDGDLMELRI